MDLVKISDKYKRGEDYKFNSTVLVSLMSEKFSAWPVSNYWSSCGKEIVGKVGPGTWVTNNKRLLFIYKLNINYSKFIEYFSWEEIWSRAPDDLVCRYQVTHKHLMVKEALFVSPLYWLMFCSRPLNHC